MAEWPPESRMGTSAINLQLRRPGHWSIFNNLKYRCEHEPGGSSALYGNLGAEVRDLGAHKMDACDNC